MNELDPIRWTESSDDAPELLRAPFAAATREGPSPAQMRMLAVKLAAVAAGTAVVAGASTAQASATASSTLTGGAAAGTALPFAKIVAAVAVMGATAWGGVALLHQPASRDSQVTSARVVPKAAEHAPDVAAEPTAAHGAKPVVIEPLREALRQESVARAVVSGDDASPKGPVSDSAPFPHPGKVSRVKAPSVRGRTVAKAVPLPQEAHEQTLHRSLGNIDVPSEVELLRRARTALASRPREAFALTEQHREHYPSGVFAQERDAIAIEALLRAGDTESARSLAKSFVSAHPSSPHAHRFRETLGLH